MNIIYLLLLIVIHCEKEVERCLLEALNKSDHDNKGIQDAFELHNAILYYHLFPQSLKNEFKDCLVSEEYKKKCSDCQECGLVYVKACKEDEERVDCSLCVKKCPEGTITTARYTLC